MAETTLGSLVRAGVLRLGDGYRTKRSELADSGYRIIRVADVTDGCVDLSSPDFVEATYAKAIGDKAAVEGDVLLTTKGTVGRVAVMPATTELAVYSPQLCFFRVLNPQRIDPRFLRYWFSSAEFWNQARDRMNNTDMAAYINLADIRSMAMTLPPISSQHAIAEVLGALDDKIAANTHRAIIADGLLRTIIADRLRDTPSCRALSDMCTVVNGVSYRSAELGESMTALVTLKSFRRDGGYSARGLKPYTGTPLPSQIVVEGEIVVAQTDLTQAAEVVGRVIRVPHSPLYNRLVASLDLAIVRPVAGVTPWYLYAVLLDERFRHHCRSRATGTTVLHLTRGSIGTYSAPLLSLADQHALAEAIEPLEAVRVAAEAESSALAATRDALLPALMSGRLRVKDAEKVVSDAV